MKIYPKCDHAIENDSSKFCRKCGVNVFSVKVTNREDCDIYVTSNDSAQLLDSNQAAYFLSSTLFSALNVTETLWEILKGKRIRP